MDHRDGVQRTIEALAARQFGVFVRQQALERGATRRLIDRRVVSGAWPIVHRGVYRVAAVPRSKRQTAMPRRFGATDWFLTRPPECSGASKASRLTRFTSR